MKTGDRKFYYKFDTLSLFVQKYDKTKGAGEATAYFNQSPIFSDPECLIPISDAFILFEGTYHIIDEVLQPYVSQLSLFFPDGQVIALLTLQELVFSENDPKMFRVIERIGSLKCAKSVNIINIGNGIREAEIMF